MKLILSLALVCTLSSTVAGALMCLQCVNPNNPTCLFPSMVECSAGEMCINAFITESMESQRIYRDCVGTAVCPVAGTVLIEANVGELYTTTMTDCCDTDMCNGAELPFPEIGLPSGRMCPGTSPSTSTFLEVVPCRGSEDTCFSGIAIQSGNQIVLGGCGSSNICDVSGGLQQLAFLDAGFVPVAPTCTLITTTTPVPTTTTAGPTTSVGPPDSSTADAGPTPAPHVPSSELLAQIKALVAKLKFLCAAINLELLHQNQVVLLQLHMQLLDYQQQLLLQQDELPIDHPHQMPLYYQQCLIVNHHQLLLHQVQLSLCGQAHLLQLFQQQQLVLHQLQELLHGHHTHVLPHYHSHLLYHHHKYKSSTEAPATTTDAPATTTVAAPLPMM